MYYKTVAGKQRLVEAIGTDHEEIIATWTTLVGMEMLKDGHSLDIF